MTTGAVAVLTLGLLGMGASLWWGWRMRWERDVARAEADDMRALDDAPGDRWLRRR